MNFAPLDSSFITNVGGIATTLIDNLKIPAMLLMGLYLAFLIIKYIINLFSDWAEMSRLYKAGNRIGLTREQVDEKLSSLRAKRASDEFDDLLEEL